LIVVAVLGGGAYGVWKYGAELPIIGVWLGDGTAPPAASAPTRPPTPVDVATVRAGTVIVTLEAVGTALANESVTVSSEVTGVIARIRFEEGQKVRQGAVLVEFDSGVEAAEVEVRQAQIQVRQAELENARQLYDRARRLVQSQNISAARVDEVTAGLKAAQAALRSAEAALKSAEARLVKQRVTAPFGGRLGIRHVSPGALIEPSDAIVTLDDISVIKLDFQVPEKNLAHIQVGQEVSAGADAYPGRVFFGIVSTIDTRVDPVTRAVGVRALIRNDDEALKPGMFMLVQLGVDTRNNAALIPEEAVVSDGTARYVYVVVDGEARRQPVSLGQRMPGEVEVTGGVEAGQVVITGGIQKVRDGAQVVAREPRPTTG
jgi:membrane fusion protein (multidrug efflux system)